MIQEIINQLFDFIFHDLSNPKPTKEDVKNDKKIPTPQNTFEETAGC